MSLQSKDLLHSNSIVELPLIIIENFFDCHRLHEAKEVLAELKEQLLNKNYPHEPISVEYDNTCFFFEKLEELMDAAYLLRIAPCVKI